MTNPCTTELWQNRTLGLPGGSFNPVHQVHRYISRPRHAREGGHPASAKRIYKCLVEAGQTPAFAGVTED